MTEPEDYRIDHRVLPLGIIRLEHGFPGHGNQSLAVLVDGEPVARLAVSKIAFEQSYSDHIGYLTLRLIAGDCLILSSRPKMPGDEKPSPPKPQLTDG